jgi:hypothetical protein
MEVPVIAVETGATGFRAWRSKLTMLPSSLFWTWTAL